MLSHSHIFISGRVQGVNFRWYIRREAKLLSLTGYVRNLPDGRVEAELEGDADKIEKMLEKIKAGPDMSVIHSVEVLPEKYEGKFTNFEIII